MVWGGREKIPGEAAAPPPCPLLPAPMLSAYRHTIPLILNVKQGKVI